MMRAILGATLALVSIYSGQLHSKSDPGLSSQPGLNSGRHSIGFKIVEGQDFSRAVTGGTTPSKVHARPIRVYLWYPAKDSQDVQSMHFGRYAELADQDIWPHEISGDLSEELKYSNKVLARSLGPERFEQLLRQPVRGIEGAEALAGPFPLIIIGQGLYYESPVSFAMLGEYLAGRGFVVATCPLVGTNSPIVRMDIRDLETQVRDLEFVIARARLLPFVSLEKLGVFGFDMGGMAGLILTMRNEDVDAFVSVSSGILYERPDGIPVNSPHYNPLALRAPWLHSVPVNWIKPKDAQVESLFDTALHSERYLLLTEGLGHVDYTSYALISGRNAMGGYWEAANPNVLASHNAVNRYIYEFFAAFLKQEPESFTFLSQDPKVAVPGSTMTLEHRSAEPTLITYEEFVQAVLTGQAEVAVGKVRALLDSNPNHILLNEVYLERLVLSLRDTWGLTAKIMPVIRLRAELYPTSTGAQQMLAEGHISVVDYPAAIAVYNKLIEQNPHDQYSKTRLEWLKTQ